MHKIYFILMLLHSFYFQNISINLDDSSLIMSQQQMKQEIWPGSKVELKFDFNQRSKARQWLYLQISSKDHILLSQIKIVIKSNRKIIYESYANDLQVEKCIGLIDVNQAKLLDVTLELDKSCDNEYALLKSNIHLQFKTYDEHDVKTGDDKNRYQSLYVVLFLSFFTICFMLMKGRNNYEK